MADFYMKLDLAKFWGASVITTKSGKEVLVIPIEENMLVKGKNGAIYAGFQATERKQAGQYGDTHYIKPKFSKDNFAKLTDEQRNSIPFIGQAYVQQNNYGNNGGGGYTNNSPQPAYRPSVGDIDDSIF
jgi:hypothetical protein